MLRQRVRWRTEWSFSVKLQVARLEPYPIFLAKAREMQPGERCKASHLKAL